MAVTMNATMNSGCSVYYGPGGPDTFTYVGSVFEDERVCVNWKEGVYYNITYRVDSTGKYKTGYVESRIVACDTTPVDRTSQINQYLRTTHTCSALTYAFHRAVGDNGEVVGSINPDDSYWLVWTAGSAVGYPCWRYIMYKVDSTGKYKRGWAYI